MTLTLTKPGQTVCGLRRGCAAASPRPAAAAVVRRGFAAACGRGGGAHTMYFADFRCPW